jgi:hypothetical protein
MNFEMIFRSNRTIIVICMELGTNKIHCCHYCLLLRIFILSYLSIFHIYLANRLLLIPSFLIFQQSTKKIASINCCLLFLIILVSQSHPSEALIWQEYIR